MKYAQLRAGKRRDIKNILPASGLATNMGCAVNRAMSEVTWSLAIDCSRVAEPSWLAVEFGAHIH